MPSQSAMDQLSLSRGHERFERQAANIDETRTYSAVIAGAVPVLAATITASLAAVKARTGGRRPAGASLISALDAEAMAFAVLTVAFRSASAAHALLRACLDIGGEVEALHHVHVVAKGPGKGLLRAIRASTADVRRRRRSVKRAVEKAGVAPWTEDQRLRVGELLLNCLLTALPDMFERVLITKSRTNRVSRLVLSPGLAGALAEGVAAEGWMRPVLLPMVEPPEPWTALDQGGYRDPALKARVPLVRTHDRGHVKMLRAAIADGSAQPFLDALNLIQGTAFTIDTRILELVRWCWAEGKEPAGFPSRTLLPREAFPEAQWPEMTQAARKRWSRRDEYHRVRNVGTAADIGVMASDLLTADTLTGAPFWLPANVDFRGRVYPAPAFNYQRADHLKAMIVFDEAKAIGEAGAWWLAVHCANCGDFDKISKRSFSARVEWVNQNQQMILDVAEDPRGTFNRWSGAASPFLFVQACLELTAYWLIGPEYHSRVPVSVDGSNSGLQHYSAALRDEDGGALVNLIPADEPADVYQAVADAVTELVRAEAATSEPARQWLAFGIERSTVKRNVMTFPYSSGLFGFGEQIVTDLMQPLAAEVDRGVRASHPFGDDEGRLAARYLATKNWQAVTAVVRRAAAGMSYLQKVAAVLAHESLGVRWTTPAGFPVLHRYHEWEHRKVSLAMSDKSVAVQDAGGEEAGWKRVQLNMRTKPTKRIDKLKARSAVAPNVIHSMDAAHLQLAVLAGRRAGVTSFALVHDSFGCHAADMDAFAPAIRQTLADLYGSYDPFQAVHDAAAADLSDEGRAKLPPPPEKGSLNLNQLVDCLYAFA